jgi:hypothetical protein
MNGMKKYDKYGVMWYQMFYTTGKAELIKLNAYDAEIKV